MSHPDATLDVRGMSPPEPLEHALEAIYSLMPGQRLRMLIDREPRPLYQILDRDGYRHESEFTDAQHYLITIWRP
jgi:uncharacterized protein (DUF2249 family)